MVGSYAVNAFAAVGVGIVADKVVVVITVALAWRPRHRTKVAARGEVLPRW